MWQPDCSLLLLLLLLLKLSRGAKVSLHRGGSLKSLKKSGPMKRVAGACLFEEICTSLKEKTELLNNNTTHTVRCTLFWDITQRIIVTPD